MFIKVGPSDATQKFTVSPKIIIRHRFKNTLKSNGIPLSESKATADTIIIISNDDFKERGITVSSSNYPKEFEINLLSPIAICFRLISCFHELLSRNPKGLFVYVSDLRTKKFNGPYNSVKKACDQMLLAYKEENERLGVNVLIQYPEAMATKLRKKVLPGEQSIDPDTTNSEAKKIISQIVNSYLT